MSDIILCILIIITPLLLLSLFANDNNLDNNKRPPAKHKDTSTLCSPGSKRKNTKKGK